VSIRHDTITIIATKYFLIVQSMLTQFNQVVSTKTISRNEEAVRLVRQTTTSGDWLVEQTRYKLR